MVHRDLPASRSAYDDFYEGDPSAENPFGREDQRQTSNRALHAHLRAGGSITTFPRAADDHAARAKLNATFDRIIASMKGGAA